VSHEPSNIALRYLQRHVLLLSLLPLGLLFTFTATLAREYHVREQRLVREWFRQGNQDFAAGQPRRALEDFRNALSYDPENSLVQMRLAETLLSDGQLGEAHTYFSTLWERSPGSGQLNLDLARVSARSGDSEEAVRFFQTAIYGSWAGDPTEERRNVRLELSEYLLAQGRRSDAQAQLMALAADISPDELSWHEKTGQMFLQAGEPGRALEEFEETLSRNPQETKLLETAGEAAFAAGDYGKAEKYLDRANHETPSQADVEMLATARELMEGDPFQAGLSDAEQASRTWRAFQHGNERLQACTRPVSANAPAPSPALDLPNLVQEGMALKKKTSMGSLIQHPDLRKEAMQFIFRVEEATENSCAAPASMDRALILMARRQGGNNP